MAGGFVTSTWGEDREIQSNGSPASPDGSTTTENGRGAPEKCRRTGAPSLGPLFVGHPYLLKREIVALSESRRTESYWVRTTIFDGETEDRVGEMLLNHATLKDSYAGDA